MRDNGAATGANINQAARAMKGVQMHDGRVDWVDYAKGFCIIFVVMMHSTLGVGGAILGVPPNLREIVSAADGVTYWASNAKAVAELGFVPRGLEVGLVDAFGTD